MLLIADIWNKNKGEIMPKLNMQGPFNLNENTIDEEVTKTSAGNYALGRKDDDGIFMVSYVGRSDSDVNDRLKYWIENSKRPLFKFSYAPSAKAAYEKECQNYHDFKPPDNDVHPDKPSGSNWKCPVCGE